MEKFEIKTSEIAEIAAKFDLVADERLEKFAKFVISIASDFSRSDRIDAYDDGLLKGIEMVCDKLKEVADKVESLAVTAEYAAVTNSFRDGKVYGYRCAHDLINEVIYAFGNDETPAAYIFSDDEMVKSDDCIEHRAYDSEFWGDVKSPKGAETRTEQVGGDHYSKMTIQPIEFINANKLSYMQGNVIKYVCRYRDKNGIEDLEKAKHYIDMMIAEPTATTTGTTNWHIKRF